MMRHQISIIGAGLGGLTSALCLARTGHDITVYEQSDALTEVGAGIQLTPNAMAVLTDLGLERDVIERSLPNSSVVLRDYKSSRNIVTVGFDPRLGAFRFIHRADLLEILVRACEVAGVQLCLGKRLKRYEAKSNTLTFEDGTMVTSTLVVGADGVKSVLRKELFGRHAPFFTGQTAWRAIVPNTVGHPECAILRMAPKRHVVSYPLRGGADVNLVLIQEKFGWTDEGWSVPSTRDAVQEAFGDFSADMPELIAGIDKVFHWGLFRHQVANPMIKGAAVLLGDAAHPTLPFMAQGANMAIEDGMILARCIGAYSNVDQALHAYQAARFERVSKIVAAANGNAWKYHLSFAPLRRAAQMGLWTIGKVAPNALSKSFDWIYSYNPVTAQV